MENATKCKYNVSQNKALAQNTTSVQPKKKNQSNKIILISWAMGGENPCNGPPRSYYTPNLIRPVEKILGCPSPFSK